MQTQQEVINQLNLTAGQIWQAVASAASEASGFGITFPNPFVDSTTVNDFFAETSAERFVVQFAFAQNPDNLMLIVLPVDIAADLYACIKGEDPKSVDESIISEVRPVFEALVQGICLGAGNIRNEPMVASGLTVRYQVPSLPANLQKGDDFIKCSVPISYEGQNGSLSWLLDIETAHTILGLDVPEEGSSPFANLAVSGSGSGLGEAPVDEKGLEIIMDIPLEVSVELGRVKMPVRDVVELGAGSIVEIDKAAGEPVDVMVNGRLVARGEVVVIDDNFGVRITEILSVQERLQKLNEAA
ncbi:MAG: flagellar motor switch protein FliN [Armatimonadetes bacterium]|nr:flagellar motor switch protein FliN [Armatimonadota bacterium]